jgi:cbb3-type cytochrome oxidase subunit 3
MSYWRDPRHRSLLLLAGAMLAIVLLAAGLGEFRLQPGEDFPYALLFGQRDTVPPAPLSPVVDMPDSLIDFIFMLGLFLLTLVLILWVLVFIFKPEARKRMLQRIMTYLMYMLLIYAMLNLMEGLKLDPLDDQEQAGGQLGEPPAWSDTLPTPPTFVVNPPPWLVLTITFALISLVLLLAWAIFRRRQLLLGESDKAPLDLLVDEAQQTLEQLQQGHDFKNSVIGCYQAMSRVLSEDRGIHRQKSMTPRDFERYLSQTGLRDDHIRRLTRLFEKVRYGGNPPDQSEEEEAIDCLSAIVQAYSRP